MEQMRIAAYVKLAKLWERNRNQALTYHQSYYKEKIKRLPDAVLVDTYIDITGQKRIAKRPEMLRLLRDCSLRKIDCIMTQTQAYLAANASEFCYLLKFIFDMNASIEIVTEDEAYSLDTLLNLDDQREALKKMANDYVGLNRTTYESWKSAVVEGIKLLAIENA